MDERVEKWLYDIRFSIEEIDSFFHHNERTFDAFCQNIILKRAIERNLEIIGEAVNRILSRNENIAIENAKKIVSLRNHIIHSYDNISEETVWAIVINHIPKLKKEIDSLLS